MKKVVIVMGSPRKNSNTHILVKEAQRGLADSGIDSEVFILNDMNIKGC
jgi:multimeric flavodoxin WrbA